MTGLSGFSYAQARLQSRYGKRAEASVWLRMHNIHDLASYLQVARQTALRPWVLGINATHSSHGIELALRQKYRQHVDEVASWMPEVWQVPLQWTKRLADLPALQYLLADGAPLEWMKSDPDLSEFTGDDDTLRLQAMREAGCANLVNAWQQGDSMFTGWLSYWNEVRPSTRGFNVGLQHMEQVLQLQMQLYAKRTGEVSATDYEAMDDNLRTVFRHYAFQPAAVCAYLASIAIDVQHIRGDLMQRLFFVDDFDPAGSLPV